MGDLLDEKKRLDAMVRKAIKNRDQSALHQKVHVVFHEQVRAERAQNTKGSTKVVIDCITPETYKELRGQIDRVRDIAQDAHIAAHLIAQAIGLVTTPIFQAWIETGYAPKIDASTIPVERKAGPPPPKAEIPDWLRRD